MRFATKMRLAFGVMVWMAAGTVGVAAGPLRPFPQHKTYAVGSIRPTVATQAQQDADVKAYYDLWKSQFLVSLGTSPAQYRVAFGKSGTAKARTVSEGQGYGMVIVAHMAGHDPGAQTIFDGLWRFAKAHPSSGDARMMQWEVPASGADVPASAFDGDADIAYGLLLADTQWGSTGAIDYRSAAQSVISGILASAIGTTTRVPLLGDWVTQNGSKYNQYTTRTSDFMYGHFRAYGRKFGDVTWTQTTAAAQSTATSLQANFSPVTGLLPDFVVPKTKSPYVPKPAGSSFLEGPNDGRYFYNACRTPWRIGTDFVVNGDAVSRTQAAKMSQWIEQSTKGDPNLIRAGYNLNGSALSGSNYFTTAFVAPFGVAAMSSPTQQAWLNKIYSAVKSRHENYYEDSLTLLSLLVMTGNYWDPTLP